jgi:hypothetical protein
MSSRARREGRWAGTLPLSRPGRSPSPRYLQPVSPAPAESAHDLLHPLGLPHQDRGLHQGAHLSRDPGQSLTPVPRRAPGYTASWRREELWALRPPDALLRLTSSAISRVARCKAPRTATALRRRRQPPARQDRELALGAGWRNSWRFYCEQEGEGPKAPVTHVGQAGLAPCVPACRAAPSGSKTLATVAM